MVGPVSAPTAPEPSVTAGIKPKTVLVGVAVTLWAALLIRTLVVEGVVIDREQVLLWICSGLIAASLASPARIKRIIVDWLPFGLALLAYDYTRGAADTLGMPVQTESIANIDEFIFGGTVPSVWLQAHIDMDRPLNWWHGLITIVYTSHLIVPFVVAGWLWWRNRDRWVRWVRRFFPLTAMGLATYILCPAMPPWLASKEGFIGHVERATARGWDVLGLHAAESLLEKGQETVNAVAAMPSLHAAFAALPFAFFWRTAGWPLRVFLGAYALGMAFVLMLGGEHYFADILLGWAYVAFVCWVAAKWEKRQAVRDGLRAPA